MTDRCAVPGCDTPAPLGICAACDKWVDEQVARLGKPSQLVLVDVEILTAIAREVRALTSADDRNTANTCGIADALAEIDAILEEVGVDTDARCHPPGPSPGTADPFMDYLNGN